MPIYDMYPYTNLHELNLDWIIKKVQECQGDIADLLNQMQPLFNAFTVDDDLQKVTANYEIIGNLDGVAAQASRLTDANGYGGSAQLPVYFSAGKPVQCNTSLNVSIQGVANRAQKLSAPITLSLSGDASGSVTTDFSADASISATVTNAVNAKYMVNNVGAELYVGDNSTPVYFALGRPNPVTNLPGLPITKQIWSGSFTGTDDGGYYKYTASCLNPIVYGANFRVEYDSVTYTGIVNNYYIGSMEVWSGIAGDYPFYIESQGGTVYIYTLSAGPHTIVIENTYKYKLPEIEPEKNNGASLISFNGKWCEAPSLLEYSGPADDVLNGCEIYYDDNTSAYVCNKTYAVFDEYGRNGATIWITDPTGSEEDAIYFMSSTGSSIEFIRNRIDLTAPGGIVIQRFGYSLDEYDVITPISEFYTLSPDP